MMVRGITLLLFLVILPGCVLARGGELQLPAQWPLQSVPEKKSITLEVARDFKGSSNMPAEARQKQFTRLQELAVKAYESSGLFSRVSTSGEPTDLRAQIVIKEEGNETLAFISGFISGFTFLVIPGYGTADMVMITTVTGRAQKVLGLIRKQEPISIWIQIFLVFAMPFRDSMEQFDRQLFTDLHRATIDEAHVQGIL